ncbi:MAG: diguanylate cyclase [Chlorobiaceae bacterium]
MIKYFKENFSGIAFAFALILVLGTVGLFYYSLNAFSERNLIVIRAAGIVLSLLLLTISFIIVYREVGARKGDAEQLRLLQSELDQRVASRTMQLNNELEKQKEREAVLKKSEQQFREMFENNSAVMIIYNPITLNIINANQSATKFYGWTQEELCQMNMREINTSPQEELKDIFEKAASGEIKYFNSSHRRADGLIRDVEVYPTMNVRSASPYMYSIIHDITERRRIERANQFRISILEMVPLKTVNELLRVTIDEVEKMTGSSIGFLHYVDDNQLALTMQSWSSNTITNMCKVVLSSQHFTLNEAGIWADALRKRSPVIHNDYASAKYRKGMPEGHAELQREAVVPIFRNNKIVALLGVGNKALDYNEDDIALIGLLGDVAWDVVSKKIIDEEHKILQLQQYVTENLAMHDLLTGLPNRRLLSERLDLTIAQCRRNKTTAALFIFDLDNFKIVNDTLGHQVGDLLIKGVATRTLGVLKRSGDSLARLGGDEYVVLLSQISPPLNAIGIAEKIRNAIHQPFELEGHTINISCSIGIALYPAHGEDEKTLMNHADAAMYQAKSEGGNHIKLYSAEPG